MANEGAALAVKQQGAPLAPVHPRETGHVRTRPDHEQGLPRLLVLIPLGSLVIAGLLVIALSRLSGAPTLATGQAPSRAHAEVQMDPFVIDEIEVGETVMHLRPAGTR